MVIMDIKNNGMAKALIKKRRKKRNHPKAMNLILSTSGIL